MNRAHPARPKSMLTARMPRNPPARAPPRAKTHPAAIASSTACAPTNISSSTRIPKSSFSSSTTTWTASSPSAPAKRTWSCASPPTSAASTVSSPWRPASTATASTTWPPRKSAAKTGTPPKKTTPNRTATGAASTHPARRARPPGPRFQRRLRGSQLLHQTRPLRNQHRALHRPLPPPVENVSGSPRRLHPQVGQAVPPAETDPPEVGQAAPPAEAATPSKSTNYHSNPKNGGIAKFSAAAMLLLLHALLHAVPELIAALAGLANLTGPHHPAPSTGARSAP